MYRGIVAALINIILNIVLIPRFGMEGAAIASLCAYWLSNIINSTKLYFIAKIHPFTKNYLKPIGVGIILSIFTYVFSIHFKIRLHMMAITLFTSLLLYFGLLILTRSLDEEDVKMFLAIKQKIITKFR